MGIGPAPTNDSDDSLLRKLRQYRFRARFVLWFERVWPAAWPPLGLAGAFVCAALLDLPGQLSAVPHAILLAGILAGEVALLVRACRRVAAPTDSETDRRLEQASGLRHRPLAVLGDKSALPGAEALWRVHVDRAAAQIGRLRIGLPRPGLAARDPRALRGALVVALVASCVIAGPDGSL